MQLMQLGQCKVCQVDMDWSAEQELRRSTTIFKEKKKNPGK